MPNLDAAAADAAPPRRPVRPKRPDNIAAMTKGTARPLLKAAASETGYIRMGGGYGPGGGAALRRAVPALLDLGPSPPSPAKNDGFDTREQMERCVAAGHAALDAWVAHREALAAYAVAARAWRKANAGAR